MAPSLPSHEPFNMPLSTALGRSEPLGALLKRLRESQARFAAITPLLPASLRAAMSAGPLDDSTWVLLAANASAAAKMRQMVPELQVALQAAGWTGPSIKIKVSAAV